MTTPVIWSPEFYPSTPNATPVSVTTLRNGTFLVTMTDWSRDPNSVTTLVYNADGTLKQTIHPYLPLYFGALRPAITELADGRIAMTWSSPSEPGEPGVFRAMKSWTEIYSPDFVPLSAQATLLSPVGKDCYADAAVALNSGGHLTAYRDGSTIYVRSIKADGTLADAILQIDGVQAKVADQRSYPGPNLTDMATLKDGSVAVAYATTSGAIEVRIVTVQDDGSLSQSSQLTFAADPTPGKGEVTVTALADGSFVVAWSEASPEGTSRIRAQIFNADKSPRTENPIVLSADNAEIGATPDIVALPEGGFAMAYSRALKDEPSSGGVALIKAYLAVFDADGVRQGNEVKLSEVSGEMHASFTHLTLLADGRLAVNWVEYQTFTAPDIGAINMRIVDPRTKAVTLAGTNGDDQYIGTGFGDALAGGNGHDHLRGDGGNDRLDGGAGNDILNGGSGADRMAGGIGNDIYYVDNRYDSVVETSSANGIDHVMSAISYTLRSYVEKLTGIGTGAISLTGNSLANTITGNAAKNTIKGGTGNDTLNGAKGNDVLSGGSGRDKFVFNTALSSRYNKDKIADWNAKDDTIQLENAVFTRLAKTGALNKAYFVIGSAAKDSNDFVGYNKSTGDLWYDSNGSTKGGHVTFANIGADKAIAYGDFVVI